MSLMARWGILALVWLLASFATPANAQVNCGNGNYCPSGNVCLQGGTCGYPVERPPGSFQTSTGSWCEPKFRENKYSPGNCLPATYVECTDGTICGPGYRCEADDCVGPEPTVQCNGWKCPAGRICGSKARTCVNTTYYRDCGNGVRCTINQACTQAGGCAYVADTRLPQTPYRR